MVTPQNEILRRLGQWETIQHSLYSSAILRAGNRGRYYFFNDVQNFAEDCKHETNLYMPNSLPLQQEFVISGIRLTYGEKADSLIGAGAWELIIGSKPYASGWPARELLSANYGGGYKMQTELHLMGGYYFTLCLFIRKALIRNVEIGVHLDGILFRPLQ